MANKERLKDAANAIAQNLPNFFGGLIMPFFYTYMGWLRTVSSSIPSEEVVQSVVQQEYFQNFRAFSNDAIYTIIMSKSRGNQQNWMPLAT